MISLLVHFYSRFITIFFCFLTINLCPNEWSISMACHEKASAYKIDSKKDNIFLFVAVIRV